MEKKNKVQGRGFIVFNGEVFGRNMEGKLPHMDKRIIADLAEKGIVVDRLSFDNVRNNETVTQTEQDLTARRNFEQQLNN